MICSNCGKEIINELECKLLNADGDFACNKKCEESYKKKRDYFFNVVIHDDKLMDEWWKE